MTERAIDVVHVGSASRDLAEDDPRGWRLGGGTTYSALATARLGLRTAAVVGVDAAAATASELDLLRAVGVELLLVPLDESPVFRNREAPGGRVQTCVVPGDRLPVPTVPAAWCEAPAWSLVPVAAELGHEWAEVPSAGSFVSLGWQGLLRTLVAGQVVTRRAPARSPLLDRADLIGVSRDDLEPGTRLAGLLRFARTGAALVVTDGAAGGRLARLVGIGRPRIRAYAAITPDREVDPTGAGDVFLAAVLAGIIRPEVLGPGRRGRAAIGLRFAAAMASFVVEAAGLHGVPDRQAVLARLAEGRPIPGAPD